MINERISALRNLMEQNKINAYVIPTSDEQKKLLKKVLDKI